MSGHFEPKNVGPKCPDISDLKMWVQNVRTFRTQVRSVSGHFGVRTWVGNVLGPKCPDSEVSGKCMYIFLGHIYSVVTDLP